MRKAALALGPGTWQAVAGGRMPGQDIAVGRVDLQRLDETVTEDWGEELKWGRERSAFGRGHRRRRVAADHIV